MLLVVRFSLDYSVKVIKELHEIILCGITISHDLISIVPLDLSIVFINLLFRPYMSRYPPNDIPCVYDEENNIIVKLKITASRSPNWKVLIVIRIKTTIP